MKNRKDCVKFGSKWFSGVLVLCIFSLVPALGFSKDLIITLKDGTKHVFSVDDIESISFTPHAADTDNSGQSTPMEALKSIISAINSDQPESVLNFLGHSDGSGPLSDQEKSTGRNRDIRDLTQLKDMEFSFGEEIVDRESEGEWHVIPAEPRGKSWIIYFAFLKHEGKWYLCDMDED